MIKSALLASTVLTISALHSPAFAQAESSSLVVDEIMVTAQKREQSLGDVPVSVTAMTAEMLKDRGTKDVFDLANAVPLTTGSE